MAPKSGLQQKKNVAHRMVNFRPAELNIRNLSLARSFAKSFYDLKRALWQENVSEASNLRSLIGFYIC